MDKEGKELDQLRFIASMFRMAMQEFNNVMGPESIRTIFRLIGERQGESVEKRMREKFNIENWTPELFAEKFVKDVFDPALGENQSIIEIDGKDLIVKVKVCPFKRAGIDISNKYYCTYTEGLIDYAAKKAFEDVEFKALDLISNENNCCEFRLNINQS